MWDSYGDNFITKGIQIGHTHKDTIGGGVYRWLGGDPNDITNNWLLAGGELVNDPATGTWGIRQQGSWWFNTSTSSFRGWDGSNVVLLG